MIRIINTNPTQYFNKNQPQQTPIKYYNNNTVTKEEIKEDFGIILDREIQKLKINVLI